MIRILAFAGGLSGAVGLSQFPEFSQQYLQRLSGAVDELSTVAVAFDSTAQASGLTRAAALDRMGGSTFEDSLRDTMSDQLSRHDRLSQNYAELRDRNALERLTQVWRFSDTELAKRTLDDFKPAVPVTTDGFICAGIGYATGWLLVMVFVWSLTRVFRRRRQRDVL